MRAQVNIARVGGALESSVPSSVAGTIIVAVPDVRHLATVDALSVE